MKAALIVKILRTFISLLLVAVLFKIMHWPFAKMLMTIGLGGIVVFYPIRFLLKEEKRFIDYTKLVLVVVFSINTYLKLFHHPTPSIIFMVTILSFYLWMILEFIDLYNNHKSKNDFLRVFPFGIKSLLFIIILIGVLYKFFEFPSATPVLITGFVLLALYLLIDKFKPKK